MRTSVARYTVTEREGNRPDRWLIELDGREVASVLAAATVLQVIEDREAEEASGDPFAVRIAEVDWRPSTRIGVLALRALDVITEEAGA